MTTFDVHQHLWPQAFVAALRVRDDPPMLRGSTLTTVEGTFELCLREHSDPERRLAALDRDGIDVAVLSLQSSLGCELLDPAEREELELVWMEGTSELVRDAAGRFRAFAPWRVAEGFVGTSVGASALLEEHVHASLLSEVDRAGGVVFVHPEAEPAHAAGRPAWWNWTVGYTAQMQRAYLAWLSDGRMRLPSVRIVFSILAGGGPFLLERLSLRGVDVRSSLDPGVYYDTATHGRRAIELCIQTFGAHQLLYGSDSPVVEPQFTLDAVRSFGEAVAYILQNEAPGALLS